ncbi:hypothetical protein CLAFUW4_01425 [Fulvia fulva]|uniref:Uncharacterized protein n=1 Tax=Passalora fulva TaxID=5499 RepID=A0A9Q8P4M4_PASFU|nr:uncharacterized protein CLAFUR5_01427 [Fulvia fulva]KAK4635187.1 hypothetical protein CLAFUR4_01426 [Fulvia fulva]KAK4638380.1 hypothetical protein CLAFUR0_01427 [Fulvia fulva]UJO13019.1 hypothetical protein CLAFUR5_01427 [Fulvia fulva]WPV09141.1 hypothetical protein CLAFUW4_01425 [Fulvia fulva]WPV25342.1 hypothetical protein CLAFUW7_01430 [Fulvia fulva]
MYRALFDKDGLRRDIADRVEYDLGDICYIDEVFLEKEYRGYGIGLLAVDGLIKSLPSMESDCFMLHAASVNQEAAEEVSEYIAASERLSEYYSLMGFDVWERYTAGRLPPLMGLCTKFMRPDIKGIVPHLIQ